MSSSSSSITQPQLPIFQEPTSTADRQIFIYRQSNGEWRGKILPLGTSGPPKIPDSIKAHFTIPAQSRLRRPIFTGVSELDVIVHGCKTFRFQYDSNSYYILETPITDKVIDQAGTLLKQKTVKAILCAAIGDGSAQAGRTALHLEPTKKPEAKTQKRNRPSELDAEQAFIPKKSPPPPKK